MRKARILFLLCLVAALTIGMAVTASADEPTGQITSVHITVTEPLDGTPIPEGPLEGTTVTVQTGDIDCSDVIASVEWIWQESGYFQGHNTYAPMVKVTLKEGSEFAPYVAVYKNGFGFGSVEPVNGVINAEIPITAAPTQYTAAHVESLPVPTPGEAIAPYSYTPEGNAFTVAGTWQVYDYQTQTAVPAIGNFEDGKLYQLQLTVTAAAGWEFDGPYLHIMNPGELYQQEYYGDSWEGPNMTVTVSVPCGEMEWIGEIPVLGAPEGITAGDTITVPTLSSKYENVNITAQWLDGDYDPASGTFQDGKVYYLHLTITPKEGYLLNGWIRVCDEEGRYLAGSETNGTKAEVLVKYSLLPKVDKVEISGVVGAVIGQAPTTEGIKAPENVHYSVDGANWHNETTYEEFTSFVDGNRYCLYIYVHAAEGYEFTEDTVVTVNGEEVEEPYINDEYIEIPLIYSFLKQLDKVDITVPAPQIGQTATLEGIVLPEGIELEENQVYWYEYVTEVMDGENYGVQKPVEGAFQKGHKYYLDLNFYVKTGYELTEEAELYLNGALVEGYNDTYGHLWSNGGYLHTCYSFMEMINKVEITGVPTPVVGQTATTEDIKITGAGKSEIFWVEEGAESPEPFTGKFEAGKAYYLQISFDSAEGTEFAENCTITVNGEETDNGWASGEGGYVSLRYSFKTVIDKVEITGLPQFSVGGTASVGSLKAPEGANYTVKGMWNDATGDDGEPYTGTFKADGRYMLYVGVEPKDGYEFAEEVQFLIDGKAPETVQVHASPEYAIAQYYFAPAYEEHGKLELTVKDPVIGGKIEDYLPKAPEDSKYELEAMWGVSEDGKTWRQASGVFEEGKYYMLRLYINLRADEENTWFGNKPQASINGVDIVWDGDENYAGPSYMSMMFNSGKLCNHTYGNWTSADGKTHSKTCSKCGDVVTENHVWTSNSDEKCDTCGYNRSDNPPTGDAIIPAALLALCSVTALVIIKRRSVR